MVADRPVSDLRRWAEKHLIVADGPRQGQRFKVGGPAWAAVLDACDDPALQQVTIPGSVQSGKTTTIIAAALGHMAQGRSVLIFEPDDKLRRALGKRLIAWGRVCTHEGVREACTPKRPPFARSTPLGGSFEVVSAKEGGAGLMRTAEIVIVDELRAFHADMLGELIDRMAAYGGSGRLITASSAGYQDECRTTAELEKSDYQRWFLHCQSCGQENIPTWKNVVYKRRRSPVYVMPCCGAELRPQQFKWAVRAGRWKATQNAAVPGIRGYHLDAFTSPFETLPTIVRQWRRADVHRKRKGSMAEVIAFQCGRLATPYKQEAALGVTPEGIQSSCRSDYDPAVIPEGAAVIIGAVDTQDNRLEAELSAWGLVEVETAEDASRVKGWGSVEFKGLMHNGRWYRLRRWAIEYRRLYGDPGSADLWGELAEYMETPRRHASGVMLRPVTVGIDSGGHYTQQVADFCTANGDAYQALKGLPPARFGAVLARRSETSDSLEKYGRNGLLMVGSDAGKATVLSMLRQSIAGADPRPCVWPMAEDSYGPQEFEGIVSETTVRDIDKRTGQTQVRWKKIARENEPLDVFVYSLAIVSWLGVGFVLSEAAAIEAASERIAA